MPGKLPDPPTPPLAPSQGAFGAPWWPILLRAGLITLALAAGALLSFHLLYEPDLGWHLAQGREIAAGRLVKTNLFSSTYPNYVQPFESWLFELGLFGLWKAAGATGIQAGQSVLIGFTLILIYFGCKTRARMPVALALAAFGIFLIEPRAVPRPHIASILLGSACVLLVERARESRSAIPLAWAIPLIALWSNIHAESLFGSALVVMFAVGEWLRPQALPRRQAWIASGIAILCVAANAANPFGMGLFVYIWDAARTPEFVRIAELRPAYLPTYAPLFVYLVCGAALLLWKRRTLALWEVLVFTTFALLALRHVRFVSLFLCMTAPMVAARLAGIYPRIANTPVLAGAALCLGFILSPVPLTTRIQQLGSGSDSLEPPAMFSSGAISFIRSAGLKGPVFNSNNLGGYLIWNMYPAVRVFQDGRFQSYPPRHFANIVASYQSQDEWNKLVAGVDWAVLTMQRYTPLTGVGRFPGEQWATVYRDQAVAVLVRRSGAFGQLAAGRQ